MYANYSEVLGETTRKFNIHYIWHALSMSLSPHCHGSYVSMGVVK